MIKILQKQSIYKNKWVVHTVSCKLRGRRELRQVRVEGTCHEGWEREVALAVDLREMTFLSDIKCIYLWFSDYDAHCWSPCYCSSPSWCILCVATELFKSSCYSPALNYLMVFHQLRKKPEAPTMADQAPGHLSDPLGVPPTHRLCSPPRLCGSSSVTSAFSLLRCTSPGCAQLRTRIHSDFCSHGTFSATPSEGTLPPSPLPPYLALSSHHLPLPAIVLLAAPLFVFPTSGNLLEDRNFIFLFISCPQSLDRVWHMVGSQFVGELTKINRRKVISWQY